MVKVSKIAMSAASFLLVLCLLMGAGFTVYAAAAPAPGETAANTPSPPPEEHGGEETTQSPGGQAGAGETGEGQTPPADTPATAPTTGPAAGADDAPKAETFTVVFTGDAQAVLATQRVARGAAATPPAAVPAPEGLVFSGWSTEEYLDVQQDLTVAAVFAPATQTVPLGAPGEDAYVTLAYLDQARAPLDKGQGFEYYDEAYSNFCLNATFTFGDLRNEAGKTVEILYPESYTLYLRESDISMILAVEPRITAITHNTYTRLLTFSFADDLGSDTAISVELRAYVSSVSDGGRAGKIGGYIAKYNMENLQDYENDPDAGRLPITTTAIFKVAGQQKFETSCCILTKRYPADDLFTHLAERIPGYASHQVHIKQAGTYLANPFGEIDTNASCPQPNWGVMLKDWDWSTETDPVWGLTARVYLPDEIMALDETGTPYPLQQDGENGYYFELSSDECFGGFLSFSQVSNILTRYAALGTVQLAFKNSAAWQVPSATYTAKSPVVFTYQTPQGPRQKQMQTIVVTTSPEVAPLVDKYALSLPGSFVGGSAGSAGKGGFYPPSSMKFEFKSTANGQTELNNTHEGGSLVLEMPDEIDLAALRRIEGNLPEQTEVTYYLRGDDSTPHTAALQEVAYQKPDGTRKEYVFDAVTETVGASRVVFTFPQGLGDGREAVTLSGYFDARVRGDVPYDGRHPTIDTDRFTGSAGIRAELRPAAGKPCDDTHPSDPAFPVDDDGVHRAVGAVEVLRQTDGMNKHTSGYGFSFLDGGTGREVAGRFRLSAQYQYDATMPTYENFSIEFTDESLAYLSTITLASIYFNEIVYENAAVVYTTKQNPTPQRWELGSHGNPHWNGLLSETRTIGIGAQGGPILDAGDYYTSLRFEADYLAAAKREAEIRFSSHGAREYFSGSDAAEPIIDYREGSHASPEFTMDVAGSYHMGAQTVSIEQRTEYPGYAYSGWGYPNALEKIKFALYTVEDYTNANVAFTTGAGQLYNNSKFTVNIENQSSSLAPRNPEIWLELDPYVVYIGNHPDIQTLERDGKQYLVLKGSAIQYNAYNEGRLQIELPMMTLPNIPAGSRKVFTNAWYILSNTFSDEGQAYYKNNPPYKIPGRNGTYFKSSLVKDNSTVPNLRDPAGTAMMGAGETISNITINTSNVGLVTTTEAKAFSGVGAGITPESGQTKPFYSTDTDNLTYNVYFGSASAPLTNYELLLHLPQTGEGGNTYSLALRGEPVLDSAGVSGCEVTYFANGNTAAPLTPQQVQSGPGWAAVTDLRVHTPAIPSVTTLGLFLKLAMVGNFDDAAIPDGAIVNVTGTYESSAAPLSAITPAGFALTRYFIAGKVFEDRNKNNTLEVPGDVLLDETTGAAVEIELYAADAGGKPTGQPLATAPVQADGSYKFPNAVMQPGQDEYVVAVALPEQYTFSDPHAGGSAIVMQTPYARMGTSGVATLGQRAAEQVHIGLRNATALRVRYRLGTGGTVVDESTVLPRRYGDSGTITPGTTEGVAVPQGYRLTELAGNSAKTYSFNYWPTTTVTLVFVVELDTYALAFDLKTDQIPAAGRPGTPAPAAPATQTVVSGQKGTAPGETAWGEYTVAGWYTSANFEENTEWDFDADTMPTQDLTLYAKWKKNTVTITLEYRDRAGNTLSPAGAPTTAEVEHGDGYTLSTLPPVPEMAYVGYKIDGGDEQAAPAKPAIASATAPATLTMLYGQDKGGGTGEGPDGKEDVTLHRQWQPVGGGASLKPAETLYINVEDLPYTAAGGAVSKHTYKGWQLDGGPQQTGAVSVPLGGSYAPRTLTYLYERTTYTVTYTCGQGSGTPPVDANRYEEGDTVTLPEAEDVVPPTGQKFAGWLRGADGLMYQPGSTFPLESNETVTAQFEPLAPVVKEYVVTYDFDVPGKTAQQKIVSSGALVPAPPAFERSGYKLKEWVADTGKVWNFGKHTMPQRDLLLVARWEAVPYTVTYTSEGHIVATEQVLHGGRVPYRDAPAIAGKTFQHWVLEGTNTAWDFETGTMPAWDMVLVAVWDQNTPANPPAPASGQSGSDGVLPPAPPSSVRGGPASSGASSQNSRQNGSSAAIAAPSGAQGATQQGVAQPVAEPPGSAGGSIATGEVPEEANPLVILPGTESWALFNLLAALFGLLCFVLFVITRFTRRTQRDDAGRALHKKDGPWRLAGFAATLISVVVFVCTDLPHMRAQMVWVNRYSPLMLVLLVLGLAAALLLWRKGKREEPVEEEPQT